MNPKHQIEYVTRLGIELTTRELRIVRRVAGFAMRKATEVYTGKPIDKPHIAQQIQAEIMVTDAEVGKGLVDVADKLDNQARVTRKKGHSMISRAAIAAEVNPAADPDVVERVREIAKDAETDPKRLDDTVLSEFERQQASQIINP